MVVDARRARLYDATDRLHALLERPLELARAAGTVDPGLTIDVLLAQRMAYGVVATAIDTADIRNRSSGRSSAALSSRRRQAPPPGQLSHYGAARQAAWGPPRLHES
jgi:hypothetical protein